MKKYLYSFVFATLILLSTTVVKASNEVYYTNRNGIAMTNEEYNNLLGLGFTEEQIETMDETLFLDNKDIPGTVLSENGKYIKKTTYLRNGITTYKMEEITEEEAMKEKKLQAHNSSTRSPFGNYYDGEVATTVIHIKAKIIGISNSLMRLKTDVDWITMPYYTYNDIIAAGFESSKVQSASTIVFREEWVTPTYDFYFTQLCTPKDETNGGSAIFALPTEALIQLRAYMFFNIMKQPNIETIYELYTSGDYAHATSNVNPSNLLSHYDVTPLIGISIDSTYANDYINYPTAFASFIGEW